VAALHQTYLALAAEAAQRARPAREPQESAQ
jgi:hypothetical protein